jgi:transcription antitermination factor NusG
MIPPPLEGAAPAPRWYAVHTRSRHERKVRDELAKLEREVFLPEYRAWSHRQDRRKQILKALFPGYLFVRLELTPERRLAILQADSVVRIVGAGRHPQSVPDHQVESIRLLLASGRDAGPHPALQPGHLVQVMEGPLRGVIGRIEGERKRRIVVSVELLGRAVSATLEQEALVPFLDGETR